MLRTHLGKRLLVVGSLFLFSGAFPLVGAGTGVAGQPGPGDAGRERKVSGEVAIQPSASSPAGSPEGTFWDRGKEGWFWYQDPPQKEETEEEQKPESPSPESPAQASQPQYPSMRDYTLDQLWNMDPDAFNELLMRFAKKAVREPSEENVTEYLTMVDIARRKAAAFAQATVFVTQSNPAFAILQRDTPSNPPAQRANARLRFGGMVSYLQQHRNDFALLYFFSPTCPYCKEYEPIIARFARKTGWEVRPVDVTNNPRLAAFFEVQTTPTTILIQRSPQRDLLVGIGVIGIYDLEQRVFRGVRYLKGETTEESYGVYPFEEGGGFDPRSIFQHNPMEEFYRRQKTRGNP